MSIFEAIVQGIVQGATEFLPVSSSGHLSLAQHIMGVKVDSLLFDILLHLGTLIAVCAVYYKLIWRLIKAFISLVADVFRGKFKWKDMDHDRPYPAVPFVPAGSGHGHEVKRYFGAVGFGFDDLDRGLCAPHDKCPAVPRYPCFQGCKGTSLYA